MNNPKMIQCKTCNSEIARNAKTCPNCGAKNKNKKGFIIGAFIVIIILFCFSSINDDSENSDNLSATSLVEPVSEDSLPSNTPSTVAKDDTTTIPTKNNLEPVVMNTYDLYQALGKSELLPYNITQKAHDFLIKHEELFPVKNKKNIEKFTDISLEYKHLSKNASKYGDKLMNISFAQVVQIEEINLPNEVNITSLNVIDEEGNQYYIYYKGELEDIFEEDFLEIYALPLDMSGFDNTNGGSTLVPVLAGSYVSKIEE